VTREQTKQFAEYPSNPARRMRCGQRRAPTLLQGRQTPSLSAAKRIANATPAEANAYQRVALPPYLARGTKTLPPSPSRRPLSRKLAPRTCWHVRRQSVNEDLRDAFNHRRLFARALMRSFIVRLGGKTEVLLVKPALRATGSNRLGSNATRSSATSAAAIGAGLA